VLREYTETTVRNPVDGGDDDARGFPLCADSGLVIQCRVLVASEVRHVIIASSIPVNRMARRMEGDIGKVRWRGKHNTSRENGLGSVVLV
jgi:hypothetical protein